MLAVASLKRSLEFDPVEQGVKRKRAEIKLSPTTFSINNNPTTTTSSPKQQSIFQTSSSRTSNKKQQSTCLPPSSSSAATDDIPMFTYAQTAQMCAHLLREQDKAIREQYEQLLTTKLNEQYEQFITYSNDSVYKYPSKQKYFHFGQPKEQYDNTSITDFSYVS